MDRLIDLQDSRLLALEQEFEMELSTLQKVCAYLQVEFDQSSIPFDRYCAMQRSQVRCSGSPFEIALVSSRKIVFARTMTRTIACSVEKGVRLFGPTAS